MRGLVVDGVIAGVGMLLTFVPLMALMFVLLAVLEDSGYLARAAVVTDRMMSRLGLPGRAFLPLVVGFGCNVPAISATRILPNARHRVLTALLVPFTSCSRAAHRLRAGRDDVLPGARRLGRVRHVRRLDPARRGGRAGAAGHAVAGGRRRPAGHRPAAPTSDRRCG